jgi:hypothetical protein
MICPRLFKTNFGLFVCKKIFKFFIEKSLTNQNFQYLSMVFCTMVISEFQLFLSNYPSGLGPSNPNFGHEPIFLNQNSNDSRL